MAHYKSFMIARQDSTAGRPEALFDTCRGVLERNGGRLDTIEMWGVKSLADHSEKDRTAHFALLDIDAPPSAIAEIERQMQTAEDVLHLMTLRVEEPGDAPPGRIQEHDDPQENAGALNSLQSELNAYSHTILEELRTLNDDLEVRI